MIYSDENLGTAKRISSQLKSIGNAVLPILNTTSRGIVVARFDQSAYLEFNDDWVCLALSSLGAGPTVLQLDSQTAELHEAVQVDTSVAFDSHRYIHIGNYSIDIDGAQSYSGLLEVRHVKRQNICRWSTVFHENPMVVGLAPLLRQIDCSNQSAHKLIFPVNSGALIPEGARGDSLLTFVASAVQALLNWVHASVVLKAPTEPPVVIKKLLGAGPGLTPSGDDFLAGVLCALHMGGNHQPIQQLRSLLLANTQQYTTPVSASLLKQACYGRINEHAHQLVECVLLSASVDAAVLQSLIQRMGASSGWDFLTGLVFGVLACQD